MKLKKQHRDKLEKIICSYKEVYESIEEKKNEMESLQNEIKSLLKKLDVNRQKEIEFGQELEKHYGKGVFNLKTGEYELVN